MPTYKTTKGGGIAYSKTPHKSGPKGIPTKPMSSEASRDFASRPKSKAIRDPKVGYGGSRDPRVND